MGILPMRSTAAMFAAVQEEEKKKKQKHTGKMPVIHMGETPMLREEAGRHGGHVRRRAGLKGRDMKAQGEAKRSPGTTEPRVSKL